MLELADVHERWRALRERLDTVILGQDAVKEKVLTCLLAGGHVLLEGVPGTGKTLLALAIAKLAGSRFRRIQFTPDLMPADLVGTNVYNQKTQSFDFRPGPIFTDLLLADEVNRTPPRTQAALLECMQEAAATVDGTRYRISPVFTVLATQNPVEFEGTYPLPEAQRDRFLMKAVIDYPLREDEARIVDAYASGRRLHDDAVEALVPAMTRDELLASRQAVARSVRVDPGIQRYILDVVTATRRDESVQWIASERFTGSYLRQLSLGDGVDANGISATYENGVLTVTIPLAEVAKPRRIEVQASTAGTVISAPADPGQVTSG